MSGGFLNYCECTLKFDNPNVYAFQFPDASILKELRKKYHDVTFLRSGDIVYFWGHEQGIPAISEIQHPSIVKITMSEHPFIVTKMLEDKALRIFRKQYQNVYRNQHSNTWEVYGNKSLLSDDGLSVKRCVTFSTYYSKFEDAFHFGFTLATQLKHRFIWDKTDFIKHRISCSDLKNRDNIIFANKMAIKRYIEARGIKNIYDSLLRKESAFSAEFEIIQKTMSWLAKGLMKTYLVDGLMVDDCRIDYLPYSNERGINTGIIAKPQRYYANDIVGTSGKYDEQLKSLKPYSYMRFSGKPIRIVAIVPKEFEGTATDFLAKLKDALIKTFHISNIDIEVVLANGIALKDYSDAIYTRLFENIDLSVIFISEKHIEIPIKESPYYFCKAKYVGQAIPTQEIQIEKLRGMGLQFIINNIALNVYAKLGGTPWGIEQTKHLKKEFIVGIGSTINDANQTVMGIANIFDSSGKYFVGECVPLSGFSDYAKKLEDSVYNHISMLLGEYDDEIRIIFHIYKSPSNRHEIRAMENVIHRMAKTNIKYAFVHVGYGHNFRLYNNDGKSNLDKGYYIHISENEALVNFVDRGNTPLKITVDKRSTFQDIYYLSQQIYWFSHLSCRSYMPAKKSVSITYPSLMASITEKLKHVDGWDYDILQKVGDKLWFI